MSTTAKDKVAAQNSWRKSALGDIRKDGLKNEKHFLKSVASKRGTAWAFLMSVKIRQHNIDAAGASGLVHLLFEEVMEDHQLKNKMTVSTLTDLTGNQQRA